MTGGKEVESQYKKNFLLFTSSTPVLGLPSVIFTEYRGLFQRKKGGRSVKLTNHL
jgi:hypothetical protein